MKRFLSLLMMFAALSFAMAGCDKLGDIFGNNDDDEQDDGYADNGNTDDTDTPVYGTISLSEDELVFPIEGGRLSVAVIPSEEGVTFEIENPEELYRWLTVEIEDYIVTFTANENVFPVDNEAEARFITPGQSEPAVLKLSQPGIGYVYIEDSYKYIDSHGGTIEIAVDTNTEYRIEVAEEYASWISCTPTRTDRTDTVVIEVAEYDGSERRDASVRVAWTVNLYGEESEWEVRISISQSAPCTEIRYTSCDGNPVETGGRINPDFTNDDKFIHPVYNLFNGSEGVIVFSGPVTKIGEDAFWQSKNIESVTIPEGVTEIESSAFFDCPNLKSFTIPQTVESIGYLAFNQCPALEALYGKFTSADNRCIVIDRVITLFAGAGLASYKTPDEAVEIDKYAFTSSPDLEHLTISDGVRAIRHDAFNASKKLTSVSLPESLRILEYRAFAYCDNLQQINIPSAIEELELGLFMGCSSLAEIDIPETVTTLGRSVFKDCTSLAAIVIPETVISVDSEIFSGCSSLKSVVLPEKFSYIPMSMFQDCTSLEHIDLPSKLDDIRAGAFRGCTALKSIEIPDSVQTLSSNSFEGCTSLTEIDTANTESIWGEAFLRCTSLETVTLGSKTKKVYEDAFKGCTKLKTIRSLATTPPELEYNAFYEPALEAIYVPEESFEAYMTDKTWLDYRSYIRADK